MRGGCRVPTGDILRAKAIRSVYPISRILRIVVSKS